MLSASLVALAAAAALPSAYAEAMLRFSCAQLVTERLDPVVNPGATASPHLHQVVGGDQFATTMTGDIGAVGTKTTCTFSEDYSNYWTAVMYFQSRNGTLKRVPQIGNQYLETANGGMTVYYVTPDDKTVNITAFKPGFRMLAGSATARTASMGYVNSYRCYTGKNFSPNPYGVSANDTSSFPTQYCAGGIRVATFFPTCWDGVNLDSKDHQSHMSYGSYSGGACPASHPVQVPQIFLETVWDTSVFPQSDWPTGGKQPFVWSQGDPTGYGAHADYVFGWKGDSLQKAMDARCNLQCSELQSQSQQAANKNTIAQTVKQDLDSWLTQLPGGMNITYS